MFKVNNNQWNDITRLLAPLFLTLNEFSAKCYIAIFVLLFITLKKHLFAGLHQSHRTCNSVLFSCLITPTLVVYQTFFVNSIAVTPSDDFISVSIVTRSLKLKKGNSIIYQAIENLGNFQAIDFDH